MWIALEAVHAALSQPVAERRLRVAAAHRDEHRLVVLVAVAVEHQQDLAERREDVERVAVHQVRILNGDVGRQERLGHAAAFPDVHRVQAEASAQVAEEIQSPADELRRDKQASRKQGFDAKHEVSFPKRV